VSNILKRHGLPPVPERKTTTTWKEFIRTHLDVSIATDFITAAVWTLGGLVTYDPAFQQIIDTAGVKRVPLPLRSPNLNAYAERWVRSVKEECLARIILFGEASLRHVLTQYVAHVHHKRNHQGKGNVLLLLMVNQDLERAGPLQCRERLGGLLKYYTCEAA
jgi:transposase InsO family protein